MEFAMKNFWKLIVSLLITFAAAAIGSLATFNSIPTWYQTLNPTAITPPNWVFGPAWTLLYILMAIALFLVWCEGWDKQAVRQGFVLFINQLILNAMWSIIFFAQHQIFFAFIEIIILWATILLTIIWFSKASKIAAWLMAPYLAWVTFAGILNFLVYLANR
jgi:tryptophan-rich sensory protein